MASGSTGDKRSEEPCGNAPMDQDLAGGAWRIALAGGFLLVGLGVALGRRPARIAGHPRAVLGALALVTLLAGGALVRLDPPALRLVLDPSTEPLLPPGDPARAVYERAVREFGDDELYAIAMETEAGVFAREPLATLRALHDELARLPGVRRVQSLADVVTFRYDPAEDWIDVGPLFQAVPESPEALAALRVRALGDPLLRRAVVSEDGRTAGITIRFAEMTDAEFIASGLDERIEALLAAAERPGLRFHVSGRPHLKASVYRGMVRDLTLLIPLALAVLAGVLVAATGSRRGVVLPLVAVAAAVAWTHAAMALLGVPITILSSMLGPQLLAIGSVYGVHLLSHYDEERGEGSAAEVALRTLRAMRLPVAISGLTTWIGFAAICMTDVPAVRELGAFSALGTGCITLLTMTGLPAALALLPPRREVSALPAGLARASERLSLAIERLLAALHGFATRRADAVIAGAVLAAGLSTWAIPRIVVDTDYVSFFAESAPVRRDFDAVNRLLAGVIPLYVVVEGDGPGAFREPAALRGLEALQARVDRIEGASRTSSLADLLRSMNRAVEADDPAAERIPDERPAVTELLQLAPKDEVGRFVNGNQSRANLVVRTGEVGSAAIRRLEAALRAAIRSELPDGLAASPTGNAILLARSADGIAGSQGRAVGLATVAIFLLVSAALRSWKLGFVALLPNLFPVLLFFGLLGLGVAPLSLPTSLIGAVALGIAIDDTVHFLVSYRRERRRGATPVEASRRTGLAVGRAIVITSAMLAAGFGVIALSSFATLREFGLLFAATVGICVVADLLLLPALLVRLRA
jgi:predicted RND superfamily exporter protein